MSQHEATPPQRYRQRGNWKELVCDEQEWLARPAGWGIQELPIRVRKWKQELYDLHFRQQLAKGLACDVCRQPVLKVCEGTAPTHDETAPDGIRQWYRGAHAGDEPKCDAWPFWRALIHYHRGVITAVELYNRSIDILHGVACARSTGIQTWLTAARIWDRTFVLELIGPNPFRPVAFSPEWFTDTAVSLARTMYESREFSAMPILADALQDAGCDEPAILDHCRDASLTHVRGCWVTDLVLGKQ